MTVHARRATDEDGMVTVEAATVIPALFLVLFLLLFVLITVHAKMQAVDASREAARLAARGEPPAAAVASARPLAPEHARFQVRDRGDLVEVLVRAQVRPFPVLPAITVDATTVAERERP